MKILRCPMATMIGACSQECAYWDAETEMCAILLQARALNRMVCPVCGGIGSLPDESEEMTECPKCEGRGVVPIVRKGE